MFSEDQLVVYPAQGVGRITGIKHLDMGDTGAEFYVVSILGSNITLMVPVTNVSNVGLRPLCSYEHTLEVFNSMDDRSGFTGYTGQNWNRRYREYSERLKTGLLSDSSSVLCELLLLGGEKELSFGERRLMEQAMHLVTIEISCVQNKSQDDVKAQIEEKFADVLVPLNQEK